MGGSILLVAILSTLVAPSVGASGVVAEGSMPISIFSGYASPIADGFAVVGAQSIGNPGSYFEWSPSSSTGTTDVSGESITGMWTVGSQTYVGTWNDASECLSVRLENADCTFIYEIDSSGLGTRTGSLEGHVTSFAYDAGGSCSGGCLYGVSNTASGWVVLKAAANDVSTVDVDRVESPVVSITSIAVGSGYLVGMATEGASDPDEAPWYYNLSTGNDGHFVDATFDENPEAQTVVILDGLAHFFGGLGTNPTLGKTYGHASIRLSTGEWEEYDLAFFNSVGARGYMPAAIDGDSILFFGGRTDTGYLSEVLRYYIDNVPPAVTVSGDTTGRATQPASFAAVGTDQDGSIASYTWDFGDGSTGQGASVTHAYTAEGTFLVTVTATDDAGATATDSTSIDVGPAPPTQPAPNQAPTSAFTTTPGVLSASFTSAATDPDDDVLTHAWTFGDGATSTETNPTRQYASAGAYNVKLVVSDGEYSAEATQTVTVTSPTAPVASFTLSSATAIEGTPITATSTTVEGSGSHSYTWFLDGTQHASGASASFNAGVGTHTVKLVVRNEYDQSSEAVKSFTVTAKPANPEPTPTPTPTPTSTQTSTATQTESPHADKESPAGVLIIPALLGAALMLRRR